MAAGCHSQKANHCPIATVQQVDAVVQEFVRQMRRQMPFLRRWSPLDFTCWHMGSRGGFLQFMAFKNGYWELCESRSDGYACHARSRSFRNRLGLMGEPSISICTLRAMMHKFMVENDIEFPE